MGNPTPPKKEGDEEPENEPNLFQEAEQEEEEEEEEESKKTKSPASPAQEEGDSISALALMKAKGLIEYELEEGETLTDIKASEILEDSMEGGFEARIEELFADLPDVVKEINKYALKGGDINVFLDAVSLNNAKGITSDM